MSNDASAIGGAELDHPAAIARPQLEVDHPLAELGELAEEHLPAAGRPADSQLLDAVVGEIPAAAEALVVPACRWLDRHATPSLASVSIASSASGSVTGWRHAKLRQTYAVGRPPMANRPPSSGTADVSGPPTATTWFGR